MKDSILQFFEFNHLPHELQGVARPFAALAMVVNEKLPDNNQRATALRKLLEAKDCAVRAYMFKSGAV